MHSKIKNYAPKSITYIYFLSESKFSTFSPNLSQLTTPSKTEAAPILHKTGQKDS